MKTKKQNKVIVTLYITSYAVMHMLQDSLILSKYHPGQVSVKDSLIYSSSAVYDLKKLITSLIRLVSAIQGSFPKCIK